MYQQHCMFKNYLVLAYFLPLPNAPVTFGKGDCKAKTNYIYDPCFGIAVSIDQETMN